MNKPNNGHRPFDTLGEGFYKIDERFVLRRPPKIKWGLIYQKKTDLEKIQHLEKLASAMNHAAQLIQEERDNFGRLCEIKEKELIVAKQMLNQNNKILQTEITRMNEERQFYNRAIAELKRQVEELQNGDNS